MSDKTIEPCIVVAGNISDGFTFFGPFEDFDSAVEWSDASVSNSNTWIATLYDPATTVLTSVPSSIYNPKGD